MNERKTWGWIPVVAVVVFLLLVGLVACRQTAQGPDLAAPSTGFGYLVVDGALKVAVPTNATTATPGVYVNNRGLSNAVAVFDGGTPVWAISPAGAVVSGADGYGLDQTWYSGTAGDYLFWDASDEVLNIIGTNAQTALNVSDGNVVIADTLDVNGDIDLDGTGLDADVTGAISLDADLASNFNTAVGDVTIEAETGSVVIKGDEAAVDAITLDANDAALTGITMVTGATSGYALTGGPFDVNVTGGVSLDADLASNFNTAAGDITIEAEVASVVIKGDEAAVDAITLDANDAALTGITMVTGATSGYALTGGPFDLDVTGAISFDADLASNFNTAAGDITLEAETGSVVLKGDEAVTDAVYIDANDAAGTGATIEVGVTGGFTVLGGPTNIGGGTFTTATGDNDLGVDDALEVNGATDLDGTLSVAGATTAAAITSSGDITVSEDTTGGNALAVNQFIGVPRIAMAGLGTMADGTTNTVLADIGDSETPATDWTAVDADTVMTNDGTYFRQGTASLKMAVAATADDGDGCTNALASGDQDWTDDEGFGFWFMATKALDAGDITLQIHDATAGGGFTDVNLPAYTTPNVWVWTELNVTLGNNNLKDVITDLSFTLSAAGAAQALAGAFDVYFDFIVKWDVGEEEALPVAILQDGVMSVIGIDVTSGGAATTALTLYTDYFIHYQSGADAIVMITDQSATDLVGIALYAY